MKIGQLADQTGLSTKTIRYYEQLGILPEPDRMANGYRSYPDTAADRIRFIRDAQTAGLSLDEIQWILVQGEEAESTCSHTTMLLDTHLAAVDRQLEELNRTRDRIAQMVERARGMDPANCADPGRCRTNSSELRTS